MLCALLFVAASLGAARPAGAAPGAQAVVACAPGLGALGMDAWSAACSRPFSPRHFLNRPVPAAPTVIPGSARVIARMRAMGAPTPLYAPADPLSPDSDYYHPVYYSALSDPEYTANVTRPWDCEIDERSFRIPAAARAASGTDGHLTVVDQWSGVAYDMWQARTPLPAGGGRFDVSCGGVVDMLGDEERYSGASAGGWGLQGGTITVGELRAGRIDHALFATVNCTAPRPVRPSSLWSRGSVCERDATSAPAIGQRLWLDMSAAEIDALGAPPWKQAILRALARYGAFVGDTGAGSNAFGLQLESDASYVALGRPGKVAAYAAALAAAGTPGVVEYRGDYSFDMATDFPWDRMRVLAPPAA